MADSAFSNLMNTFTNFGRTYDDMIEQYYNQGRQQAIEDRDYNAMREDTAYQRAVADLKAAGLNPWLATGNPASSQAISQVSQTSSKMREIGVQYTELMEKTIDDALDKANQTANTGANLLDKVGAAIQRIWSIPGIFD